MATKRHHKKRKVGTHKVKRDRRVSGRKTTTRRRRRVGASNLHEAILFGAGVVGGALVTPFLVQGVNSAMGSGASAIPAWMVPGGAFATGVVVAGISKGNQLMKGAGAGMAAIGAVMAANEIGLSEPGISGTAFSNNTAPGAKALTTSVGCSKVGSPQRFVNNSVGSHMETMAIGALYSN